MTAQEPEHARLVAALRRAPDDAQLHNDLANLPLATGQAEPAAIHYRIAIRHVPERSEVHFNLANALAATGDNDAAINSYRRSIALDPSFAGAHNNHGNLLRKLGRPAEALEAYRRALYLTPLDAARRYNLGTALHDLARPTDLRLPPSIAVDALTDFAETAGLVAQMALMISVNTAIVHLAGAMARPVWVILATNAGFRWLEDRTDSPRYPTARIATDLAAFCP